MAAALLTEIVLCVALLAALLRWYPLRPDLAPQRGPAFVSQVAGVLRAFMGVALATLREATRQPLVRAVWLIALAIGMIALVRFELPRAGPRATRRAVRHALSAWWIGLAAGGFLLTCAAERLAAGRLTWAAAVPTALCVGGLVLFGALLELAHARRRVGRRRHGLRGEVVARARILRANSAANAVEVWLRRVEWVAFLALPWAAAVFLRGD